MPVFSDCLVFDGSGRPPFAGDVVVEGGRIREVRENPPDRAASGARPAIAPGFIDLHSHSDVQVLERRLEKIKQGVTTEVVGNCGFSTFPQSEDDRAALHEFGAGILGPGDWGWPHAAGYLQAVRDSGALVRVEPLVGHGSLRVAVMGLRQDAPTARELNRMTGLLEDALDEGCAGFSTGLMYAPGSAAGRDELVHLCRLVARKGKLYTSHMRSYAAGLVEAVREQLDLAETAGCRLQISHLQAAGRENWGLQGRALEEIETARNKRSIDVEFDIYPYQCGSTVLTQWLPQWALEGGPDALVRRIGDASTRARLIEEMERAGRAEGYWADMTISAVASEANAALVGRTVAGIAEARGCEPAGTVLDLVVEEHAAINVISFNQSEANLRQLLTHPLCSVISDGFYVKGKPHPRLHGTFPELLGAVVRRRGWMSLEEAIHKVTAKPAARLGFTDRGRIEAGAVADLVVFDAGRVESQASYEDPCRDPVGILKVVRGGLAVHATSAL